MVGKLILFVRRSVKHTISFSLLIATALGVNRGPPNDQSYEIAATEMTNSSSG